MLKKYKTDWEEFAILDKKWAIVTIPQNKYSRWDETDFFSSGERTIADVMKKIENTGLTLHRGSVLDFGCGVGRLTFPLSERFRETCGLDVSQTMIDQAMTFNLKMRRNISFMVNSADNLGMIGDRRFDLAVSLFCLQHIESKEDIESFIKELARILVPGGILFFQLPSRPSYSPLRSMALKFRARLYDFCTNKTGLSRRLCYETLRLSPYMHMNHLKSESVKKLLDQSCDKVIVLDDNSIVTAYIARKKIS
jgi:ubiquinone/menaquinone biosynthesis C-methylase UbiE